MRGPRSIGQHPCFGGSRVPVSLYEHAIRLHLGPEIGRVCQQAAASVALATYVAMSHPFLVRSLQQCGRQSVALRKKGYNGHSERQPRET